MAVFGPHDKEFIYYCLSTDIKPSGVIGNSVLYEIDAGTLHTTRYRYSGSQWVEDVSISVSLVDAIESSPDVVTTVDLSDPANLSIASVSASVGKTATTTVAIGATSLVITRSVA